MKKRLKTMVVIMVVSVFGISESLRAAISNSVIEDDIEYYIEVDKSVYNLGEDVEFLYRITNLSDEERRFIGSFPLFDVLAEEKDGEDFNEIWNLTWGQAGPMGPMVYGLGSHESIEINALWPQINLHGSVEIEDHTQVLAGSYRLSGICYPTDVSIPVDIDIVPEPGSLSLLLAGSIALLKKC
jgi:hypothetical protein